jgi:hypothetical protein
MDPVIVTVKRKGLPQLHDIEVRPDLPATDLVKKIVQDLGWGNDAGVGEDLIIEVYPSGSDPARRLGSNETLAQVGAGDGSWLVLMTVSELETHNSLKDSAPTSSQSISHNQTNPLRGWRKA